MEAENRFSEMVAYANTLTTASTIHRQSDSVTVNLTEYKATRTISFIAYTKT